MEKVYKKYFHNIDSAYFVFSRFASFELIFEDFPDEYFDKNIRPRMGRKETDNSIGRILQECGLVFIGQYLGEESLSKEEALQENNYRKLREVIIHHKAEIQDSFMETCRAAKKYIMDEIKDCKNVCVVDLGWNGKSIVYLKHLCERKYQWNGSIIGAMVGACKSEVVQNYIRTGLISTYAFENELWRNRGKKDGVGMEYEECICMEALFSSESDTLLRYGFDENGDVKFIYGKKNKNQEIIREIHNGILDFAENFMPVIQKYDLKITARDAYIPLDWSMKNEKYKDTIYKKYYEEPNAMNGF
ncbi:MAG: hypothetical protein K2N34_02485 [Lachnospiraceae bacterium]|nr:hypothetical protein [Lachnospiraceae bacterium]